MAWARERLPTCVAILERQFHERDDTPHPYNIYSGGDLAFIPAAPYANGG